MPQELDVEPCKIVRQLLIDLGLGLEVADPPDAWTVYATGEPSDPDRCITVFDADGVASGRYMFDGRLVGSYGVNVRVRSAVPEDGRSKMSAIRNALAAAYKVDVAWQGGAYLVHDFHRIGQVHAIGKDTPGTKRNAFTLNALASIDKHPLT